MKTPLHRVASVVAARAASTGMSRKKLAREVAAYLLDTGRTGELNSLGRETIKIRADGGIVEVTAVSALGLSKGVEADIRREVKRLYPKAKQIIIDYRHDPNLIGGLRLEIVDQQLDLSVRHKLNRFKALTTTERTS